MYGLSDRACDIIVVKDSSDVGAGGGALIKFLLYSNFGTHLQYSKHFYYEKSS